MLIPAFGIYSMLEKANKAIWQELISCHFKNIQNACGMPFGFIFYLKPLTATWIRMCFFFKSQEYRHAPPFATHRTISLPFFPGRQ